MTITKAFAIAGLLGAATLITGCGGDKYTDAVVDATNGVNEANVIRAYKLSDYRLNVREVVSPYDKNRICIFLNNGSASQCFNNVTPSDAAPTILATYKLGKNSTVVEFNPSFSKDIRCVAIRDDNTSTIYTHRALSCN